MFIFHVFKIKFLILNLNLNIFYFFIFSLWYVLNIFGDKDITKALENYGIKFSSQLTISLQILLFNLPAEVVIDTFAYKGMLLVQK